MMAARQQQAGRGRRGLTRIAFLLAAGGLAFAAIRFAPSDYTGPVTDLAMRSMGGARPASAPPAAAAKPAIPVTVALVATRDIPIYRTGVGTVTPLAVVDVKPRVEGQIRTLFFREGDVVEAGDRLAELDPRTYAAIVAQAEAVRDKTRASLASAEIEDARARKLTSSGAGTLQSADAARAQLAIMKATSAADQASLDLARLNLDFTTVRAPIGGRVGLRQINEGAIVQSANPVGIVTITQMKPIAVLFSLPQEQLPDVLSGSRAGPLPVFAERRDGQETLAEGVLSVVDSQVDPGTGMIRLKAVFPNEDGALWPGQFVTARIRVRDDRGVAAVPDAAIQNGQKGSYVFVVNPDRTVSTRPVKPGPGAEGFTALVEGPNPGTEIVLSGQARLTNGARIEPRREPPVPTAGATRSRRG